MSLVTLSIFGQYTESFQEDIFLAEKTKNYSEGYIKSTGLYDFTYHSFREDGSESMLTRCTKGKMSIQWERARVAKNVDSGCGFLWMAAMNPTEEECMFDMYVDGIKRFEIFSASGPDRKVTSIYKGNLAFYPVDIDHHGDAHGCMTLEAPSGWLSPGRPLEIRITGSHSDSNTWIIVYKASDALSYLQQKVRYSIQLMASFSRKDDSYNVVLYSLQCFAGKELEITAGVVQISGKLISKNHRSELSFNIDISHLKDGLIKNDNIGE